MIPELPAAPPVSGGADPSNQYFHTLPVAVVYPLLQSTITGISLGLSVGALAWVAGHDRPAALGLLSASIIQSGTWLLSLSRWHKWVYRLEDLTGWDLNQDGRIGREDPPEPVRVEVIQDNGRRVDFIDLPASQDQLVSLASGLITGIPLSENNWTGSGAPFSKREFHSIRDLLIRRGLARWINPRARAQGLELTGSGRSVMRRFASLAAAPTPTIQNRPQD